VVKPATGPRETASFVVKTAPRPEDADPLTFDDKSMWRGKNIHAGDEVFMFAAEHNAIADAQASTSGF